MQQSFIGFTESTVLMHFSCYANTTDTTLTCTVLYAVQLSIMFVEEI